MFSLFFFFFKDLWNLSSLPLFLSFFLPSFLRALSLSSLKFPPVSWSFLEFPRVSSSFLKFPQVSSSSLEFYGFKWVQMSCLEFSWVPLSSFGFPWVSLSSFVFPWVALSCLSSLEFLKVRLGSLKKLMWKKGMLRFVPLFSWFFLTCFFLRALSYSTCLSIFFSFFRQSIFRTRTKNPECYVKPFIVLFENWIFTKIDHFWDKRIVEIIFLYLK